eukprot:tig00001486_g8923.t1
MEGADESGEDVDQLRQLLGVSPARAVKHEVPQTPRDNRDYTTDVHMRLHSQSQQIAYQEQQIAYLNTEIARIFKHNEQNHQTFTAEYAKLKDAKLQDEKELAAVRKQHSDALKKLEDTAAKLEETAEAHAKLKKELEKLKGENEKLASRKHEDGLLKASKDLAAEKARLEEELRAAREALEAKGAEAERAQGEARKASARVSLLEREGQSSQASLLEEISRTANQIITAETGKKEAEAKLQAREARIGELERLLAEERRERERERGEVERERAALRAEAEERQAALEAEQARGDAVALAAATTRAEAAEARLAEFRRRLPALFAGAIGALREELGRMRRAVTGSLEEAAEGAGALDRNVREAIRRAEGDRDSLLRRYREEVRQRRKLYDALQEAKGAIRVFCRVRPLLPDERSRGDLTSCSYPEAGQLGEEGEAAEHRTICVREAGERGRRQEFEFDRVFSGAASQEEIFEEAKALVTSALDGYSVTIMAYGQTGSGKTYTMEGPPGQRGVNIRTLEELLRAAELRAASGDYEYKMWMSMLEVYNDELYDLLTGSDVKLETRSGPAGLQATNAREVAIGSMEEVLQAMAVGYAQRSTAETLLNRSSSRSHCVLRIRIEGSNPRAQLKLASRLCLVDLAGSERVKESGATGDRLKEAQHINKSLSALGDVMSALQCKQSHIPYRNSKLTHLLQDSLAAGGKTLVFATISPSAEWAHESICTLNFASRVARVVQGPARKNVTAASPSPTPEGALPAASSARSSPTEEMGPPPPMTPRSRSGAAGAGGEVRRSTASLTSLGRSGSGATTPTAPAPRPSSRKG